MITHIVFFKLNAPSAENIKKLREVLLTLPGKIPQIRHFEVGVDILPSERSYDLALYSTFDSVDDLQVYKAHPEHLKVVDYIEQVAGPMAKVDYES